jgi:hypothetical protein
MKRLAVSLGAVALLAIPVVSASADQGGLGYSNQPGYDNASECGQYHGAFGAFGKDNNFAGGADGAATALANSAKGCQRNQ